MSSSTKFPKALSAMLLRCRRNVVFDRRTGEPLGIFLHARPAPDSLFGRLQPQPPMLPPVEAQAAPRTNRTWNRCPLLASRVTVSTTCQIGGPSPYTLAFGGSIWYFSPRDSSCAIWPHRYYARFAT